MPKKLNEAVVIVHLGRPNMKLIKWTKYQAQNINMTMIASSRLITTATESQDYPSFSTFHSYTRLHLNSPRVNGTNFAIYVPGTGHSHIGLCYSNCVKRN